MTKQAGDGERRALGAFIAGVGMLRRDVADDIAAAICSDLASPLRAILRGWSFKLEDAPSDQPVILAAIGPYGWTIGEASRRSRDGSAEFLWWWADAPPGEYHSDDVVNMGATPTCWMHLPDPPTEAPPPPSENT